MAFSIDNYNVKPGSDTDVVAQALDSVFEALADGVSITDAGPVLTGLTIVASKLMGKPLSEIKGIAAKAALAVLFDELSERKAPN